MQKKPMSLSLPPRSLGHQWGVKKQKTFQSDAIILGGRGEVVVGVAQKQQSS